MNRQLQQVTIWSVIALGFLCGGARADFPDVEAEIVELLKDHPEQGRADMVIDPELSAAAQEKADDMMVREYFAHTDPDGLGPNVLVQRRGFFLPADYSNASDGNNIESLALDRGLELPPDAARTIAEWVASPGHRLHVLGENPFFAAQVSVGVGIARNEELDRNYYVFFSSAPPVATDVLPPLLRYDRPKAKSRANKMMFHKGSVYDPLGIAIVQFRLANKAWETANFSPADGRWSGRTVLTRAFYRKVKKGRRSVIVQVRVRDAAGNWTRTSRLFKNRRR